EDPRHWNVSQAVARWYATAMLALGEVLSLAALDSGKDKRLFASLVWAALIVGVYGIAAPVLGRQWGYVRQWLAHGRDPSTWFVVWLFSMVVGMTWAWVYFYFLFS